LATDGYFLVKLLKSIASSIHKRYLHRIYDMLFGFYGPQGWWPAETKLEIIIGAILVQGTNWNNAFRAIQNLKNFGMLNVESLYLVDIGRLVEIIRPAGFQRVKAVRIKRFIERLVGELDGRVERLCMMPIEDIRVWLLDIPGIGRETADNIILYACGRTIFPVDRYTIRLFRRLGIIENDDYEYVRRFVEENMPKSLEIYKEFRALIVRHCKEVCRARPLCERCILRKVCQYGAERGK